MRRIFLSLLLLIGMIGIASAQSITIKGIVVDESGEGLPGASVMEKNSKSGTITDLDGKFTLQIPGEKSIIIVSFVGYKQLTVNVGKERNFTIKMKDDSQMVDEVVVVGFASQAKSNITGAVASVNKKALEARPIANAIEGLQGTTPGLNITNDNGGSPGRAMDINIRGLGTIGEGSTAKPLILIDGIEGDLATVNPNDIETISVLKDAASASVYGSRAPFGVILITTRSGDKGTIINYSGNLRLSQPVSLPNPADSYSYAIFINDAYSNGGGNPPFGAGQLKKILDFQQGKITDGMGTREDAGKLYWTTLQNNWGNTDFYDVHLRDFSYSHEHNASVSGGSDKVNYYFSANYMKQSGIFRYADDNFTRLNISAKVTAKIFSNLMLTYSMRLINTTDDKPSGLDALFFHNLGRIAPLASLKTPMGEFSGESLVEGLRSGGRQVAKQQQLYNQANLQYEPIKDWKIYFDFGSRIENPQGTRQFKKVYLTQPDGRREAIAVLNGVLDRTEVNQDNGEFRRQPPGGVSYYERYSGKDNYINTNFRSDFARTIGDHYFMALIGTQIEYFSTEKVRVSSDNILLDETPFLPSSQGINPMMSEKRGEWASIGFFGRLNYTYGNKYMIQLDARRDGASRFPVNQQWGIFPSVSLAWNIAKESFWRNLEQQGFEMLKIRGSYGVLGNQNTSGFYPSYQKMYVDNGKLIMDGANSLILAAPAPYSTNLTWEKIESAGCGIDIGFWSNRLNASFDWYQRTTRDMVGPSRPLPAVSGAAAPKTNNAALRTRGWEMEILWRDMIGKDFSYEISATLSDYKSVVTKYDSPDGASKGYYTGKQLGDIWGYEVEGIAKNDLEMHNWLLDHDQNALGTKWGGGDIMYRDLNGDGKVNAGGGTIFDRGDLKVIGNGTPHYAYGFRFYAKYKFIDISAFFQGIGKREVFFDGSATFFGCASEWQRSVYVEHLDYFRYAGDPLGENTDAYYARPRFDGNNRQVSDYYLQDASYLRLKNLQIGFSLPEKNPSRGVIKKARLYISGENLLTFTKLRIYDPEAIGSGISEYGPGKTYPNYRVFSVGLNITF